MPFPRFLAAAALIALAPLPAWACSCAPMDGPEESLQRSGQVFRGTVLGVEVPDNLAFPNRTAVDFRVDEVWKGEPLPLLRIHTPANSAACGRSFEPGLDYLVYAETWGDVILCSRTAPLPSAQADLQALGEGVRPAASSVALLARHAVSAGAWYRPEAPGEGIFIELLDERSAALYWYGFDPALDVAPSGQRWLFGIGHFEGSALKVDSLQRLVGAGFAADFDPGSLQGEEVGSLSMDFQGNARAQLRYRLHELGGTPIELSLQRLTRPPLAGLPDAR